MNMCIYIYTLIVYEYIATDNYLEQILEKKIGKKTQGETT